MTKPTATYRLQFRNGMTFARAAALAPYWRELGISHLYASPVFAAVSGSTHGYDVTDPNALEPSLGGETGFRQMAAALAGKGLGLILDFVPNHMAASAENPWWYDVLRHGVESRWARHFDIDWGAGPLTLPFLGASFEEAAERGELTIEPDEGGYVLRYYEAGYPLNARGRVLIDQARKARGLPQLVRDTDFLARLHEAQHWRLGDWRSGRYTLTYRRFFEITGLVGLRVEEPAVFEDVHAKLFALVDEGLVQGIRIDHVDGLADPAGYLQRLRGRIGPKIYLIVEKILEGHETLPDDWPVHGTTGYEFIADVAAALTDASQMEALDAAYRGYTGNDRSFDAEVATAKRDVVDYNLAAERHALVALAIAACTQAWPASGWTREHLEPAIAAATASVPVYRTYVTEEGPGKCDRNLIDEIARRAVDAAPQHREAIETVAKLLALDVRQKARSAALAFTTRFQQTTGAVMAKAVEDTAFYRFNRLIALNEVGGSPARTGSGPGDWHAHMVRRADEMRLGLSATATHDTKRGEDARARLYTLSEAPELWRSHIERWEGLLTAPHIDLETRWLLYQALLGVWPAAMPDQHTLVDLSERFAAYARKVVREAKRYTSWSDPDPDYEQRVQGFAASFFADENANFRADFSDAIGPFVRAGAVNSLAQLLFRLTAPGIPDFYQGTEMWDLSLVDPDNRRSPDFDLLAKAIRDVREHELPVLMARWMSAAPKRHLLLEGLKLRTTLPELFDHGAYSSIDVRGPQADHIVAFARVQNRQVAIVVAPRCVLGQVTQTGPLALEPAWLEGTSIDLGWVKANGLHNVVTGASVHAESVDVASLLAEAPVALLVSP